MTPADGEEKVEKSNSTEDDEAASQGQPSTPSSRRGRSASAAPAVAGVIVAPAANKEAAKDDEELKKLHAELDKAKQQIGQLTALLDYARKNQDEQQNRMRVMEAQAANKKGGGLFGKKDKGGKPGNYPAPAPPPPKASHKVLPF